MKQRIYTSLGAIILILSACISQDSEKKTDLTLETISINDSLLRERIVTNSGSTYFVRKYFFNKGEEMTYLLSFKVPDATNAAITFYPNQTIENVAVFDGEVITENIKGFYPNGKIRMDSNERTNGYMEISTYFDNGAIHLYKLQTPNPDSKLIYQAEFDSRRPRLIEEQGERFFLWVDESVKEAEESVPFLLFTSKLPYHEYKLSLYRRSADDEVEEQIELDYPSENFLSLHLSKQVLQEASYLVEMERKSFLNDSIQTFRKIISKN